MKLIWLAKSVSRLLQSHTESGRAIQFNLVRSVWVLFVTVLVAGCGPNIAPEDLPQLPPLDVSGYQDAVIQQITTARSVVDEKPANAKANGHLGMLYRAYRDFEVADIAFSRARLLAPGNTDWMYYHGEVLEQLADYDGAMKAMHAVLEEEPEDLPARLHLADMLIQTGEVDDARKHLRRLAKKYPDYSGIQVVLATALEHDGELVEAAAAWRRALEFGGDFCRGHYALAQLYRRLDRTDDANHHLIRFNAIGNTNAAVLDPRLEKLFKLNRSDRPLILAAQSAKARRDNKQAIELLEQAITRNPANLETRAALITGYAISNKLDEAEAHYEKGKALNPNHVELNYAFGRLRQQQGRNNEALEVLTEVTQQAPKHANARAWQGRVYELLGNARSAGESYRLAVESEPKNRNARQFYTVWLLKFGAYTDAEPALTRMASIDLPDRAMVYSALAVMHDRNNQKTAALEALNAGIAAADAYGQQNMSSKLRKQRTQVSSTISKP